MTEKAIREAQKALQAAESHMKQRQAQLEVARRQLAETKTAIATEEARLADIVGDDAGLGRAAERLAALAAKQRGQAMMAERLERAVAEAQAQLAQAQAQLVQAEASAIDGELAEEFESALGTLGEAFVRLDKCCKLGLKLRAYLHNGCRAQNAGMGEAAMFLRRTLHAALTSAESNYGAIFKNARIPDIGQREQMMREG